MLSLSKAISFDVFIAQKLKKYFFSFKEEAIY